MTSTSTKLTEGTNAIVKLDAEISSIKKPKIEAISTKNHTVAYPNEFVSNTLPSAIATIY